MTTRRWERIRALGEGGESTELGGGLARPSHGASVEDSPLTYLARDGVLPMAAARTELAVVTPLDLREERNRRIQQKNLVITR